MQYLRKIRVYKKNDIMQRFLSLIFIICPILFCTSCMDGEFTADNATLEQPNWSQSFAPIELLVKIEDKAGNNLLDANFANHLDYDNISVSINGETYPIKTAADFGERIPSTQNFVFSYYPTLVQYENEYALYLGQCDGSRYCDLVTVTIDWGNDTQDTISFCNILTFEKNGKVTDVTRDFYLNGKINETHNYFTIVK